MNSPHRKLAVGLLACLVLGMAVASLHVSTHGSGGLPTCELCCGHANPSHALPPSGLALSPAPACIGDYVEPLDLRQIAPGYTVRSRGPPAVS